MVESKKKNCRKPDMQIYVPGRGFNKNTMSEDNGVYMPKAKVASKVTGQVITSSKGDLEENYVSWKQSNSHCDRQSFPEVKFASKYPKKGTNLIKNEINNGQRAPVSPSMTSSWTDQVEESDISSSRSSPDNKLCNSRSNENVHLYNSSSIKQARYNPVNYQKSNKEGHRQNKENTYTLPPRFQKQRLLNLVTRNGGISKISVNTNSLDRIQSSQKNNLTKTSATKRYSSEYNALNSNSISNTGTKFERRKKEKESTLRPRFQKQKSQNLETSSTSDRNDDILKTSVDLDNATEVCDQTYILKSFPEPPNFTHNQLLDVNNPSKSEIIHIRSPVPPPPFYISPPVSPSPFLISPPVPPLPFFISAPVPPSPFISPPVSPNGDMNPFYAAEPTPYIQDPVAANEYIPPPQPLASNRLGGFCPKEIDSSNTTNGYLQSSFPLPLAHFAQLNGMLQPPSHTNPDVALNDEGKKSFFYKESYNHIYRPDVEKNLHEIAILEKEMLCHLAKDLMDSSNLSNLRQSRCSIQLLYENIILTDSKYCAEKNPEHSLWKTVYHQVIESLRKKIEEDSAHCEEIKEILLSIILEGTMFYENFLKKQEKTYGFKLNDMLNVKDLNTSCLSDRLHCVLISVQKIFTYLGDLALYKEQVSATSNYGKARSWYLKAQKIAPENGKPYHHLAIVSTNQNRKLDAVYYYMRSLAASNPFLSAKESLLSLFEEAKRKYESYEKKRRQENMSDFGVFDDSKIDGSSTNSQSEPEKNIDASDLKKLSDVKLNKRFVTSFLHVHGKLFTKVGMETFPDTLKNMLKEFHILMQRTPLALKSTRLMQLLAMNIFSVQNSSAKENGREYGKLSLLEEQALYTTMAMMSIVMDRCCMLHAAHKSAPGYANHIIGDDFTQLLSSVKVWTDWVSCRKYLWPLPSVQILEKLNVKLNKNIWTSFADFLTVLLEIDTSDRDIMSQHIKGSEPIMLEEDEFFAGFGLLPGAIPNSAYVMPPNDDEKARNCLRISKIQFFGDYLCGVSPPYLEFHVESKRFVPLVVNLSFEEKYERSILLNDKEITKSMVPVRDPSLQWANS